MNISRKGIQAWRARREQRSLQWWEEQRAKGQTRFIIRTALTYSLAMIGVRDVIDSVFNDGIQSAAFSVQLFSYPISGIVLAMFAWSRWEGRYRNALIQARVDASPSGNALPDGDAKRMSN